MNALTGQKFKAIRFEHELNNFDVEVVDWRDKGFYYEAYQVVVDGKFYDLWFNRIFGDFFLAWDKAGTVYILDMKKGMEDDSNVPIKSINFCQIGTDKRYLNLTDKGYVVKNNSEELFRGWNFKAARECYHNTAMELLAKPE